MTSGRTAEQEEDRHAVPDHKKKETETKMRDKVILACQECKERNYSKTKNKRLHPERVEHRKYCPRCRTHTQHKETK